MAALPAFSTGFSKGFISKTLTDNEFGNINIITEEQSFTAAEDTIRKNLVLKFVANSNPTMLKDWVSLCRQLLNNRFIK